MKIWTNLLLIRIEIVVAHQIMLEDVEGIVHYSGLKGLSGRTCNNLVRLSGDEQGCIKKLVTFISLLKLNSAKNKISVKLFHL